MPSISREQIRAARGMLDWTMIDLAKAAKISLSTVKRAEEAGGTLVSPLVLKLVQDACGAHGIEFLPDEGQGAGVRFNPRRLSFMQDNHPLRRTGGL